MKAACYEQTGPAREVLRVTELDRPEPGPGQVRVRVAVSGINPTDVAARDGSTPRPIEGFQIPHHDGVGTIDAVGDGVSPDRVGQRVWVWFAATGRFGTAAQWSVIPEQQAVVLPDAVSDDLAASLGIPAMTAHRCLFADGPLDGGAVLIAGGAGAVGHFAIQLAHHDGARVVATISSQEKAELARAAGAETVVNYRDGDAAEQIRTVAPQPDRIVEVAPAANLEMDVSLAGPATTVVSYAAGSTDPTLPVRDCMTANVTLRFVLVYNVPAPALQQAAEAITGALTDGSLTTLPTHRFPLDEVAGAHEAVESGVTGKVVIELP
ncbi:NADPH:quinone reductase [Pseudonocardia nantongensis]|uniref:NADPH:quinone reductase n=1 Tax=Pseudonocardia nantongensis TaxID=1181885 RepID=UPI0039791583